MWCKGALEECGELSCLYGTAKSLAHQVSIRGRWYASVARSILLLLV